MNGRECAVMESRVVQHEKELTDITKSMRDVKKDIALIQASISQIRNVAYGAVAMLMMSQLGLGETIATIVSK